MACKTCLQKKKLQKSNNNCESSYDDISSLIFRLSCAENKIQPYLYNKYLGILQSMINMYNYCLYSTEEIINTLNEHNC